MLITLLVLLVAVAAASLVAYAGVVVEAEPVLHPVRVESRRRR